jgi:hypothetical protein
VLFYYVSLRFEFHDEDKQNKKKTTQKCVGDHYAQGNTINVNKTWGLLQTTGGKGEPHNVVLRKS